MGFTLDNECSSRFWFLQPRYVVNRVTAGDYDCPRKVMKFLTDLHAAFRMLNLRNDFLRKKFDGRLLVLISICQCLRMDELVSI